MKLFIHTTLLLFLSTAALPAVPQFKPDPLLVQDSLLLPMKGVTVSKDIRMRALPSTTNTRVVDVLPFGTPVTLHERGTTKEKLSEYEGHWFRVSTPSGKEGWIFGKFLVSEESPFLKEHIEKTLKQLWHARPQLEAVIKRLRAAPYDQVKKALEGVKPQAFNYVAYYLLAEQHPNALPVLNEYMSPSYKKNHESDPNYFLNWEILSRLVPNQLLDSNYDAYDKFWGERGSKYSFPVSRADIFSLVMRVKQAEDRHYRKED